MRRCPVLTVVQARYRHKINRQSLRAVYLIGMYCYLGLEALKERPEKAGRSGLFEAAVIKRCRICIRSCNSRMHHSHIWLMPVFQRR